MKVMILDRMIGKIPVSIVQSQNDDSNDTLTFTFSDNTSCMFYHQQNCCESVALEEVAGDWSSLIGHPLIVAEERISYETDEENSSTPKNGWDDSFTWTFYTFRSVGGTVDVRWYGTSNGYYSESVDCYWFDSQGKPHY